jgi:hypothetical protein
VLTNLVFFNVALVKPLREVSLMLLEVNDQNKPFSRKIKTVDQADSQYQHKGVFLMKFSSSVDVLFRNAHPAYI